MEQKAIDLKDLLLIIGDKEVQLYFARKKIEELEAKIKPQTNVPAEVPK